MIMPPTAAYRIFSLFTFISSLKNIPASIGCGDIFHTSLAWGRPKLTAMAASTRSITSLST